MVKVVKVCALCNFKLPSVLTLIRQGKILESRKDQLRSLSIRVVSSGGVIEKEFAELRKYDDEMHIGEFVSSKAIGQWAILTLITNLQRKKR